MYPVLLKAGYLTIYSYGFMLAVAFLAGIFVTVHYAKKEGIRAEVIFDLALYVILASVIGARIFYVIGQWEVYRDNPLEIIMVQRGGLVFLGGLLLAIAVVFLYARIKKINILKLLDAITPGVALGYAIGRMGCFLNGCCFGLPTDLPWGMVFPSGSLADLQYHGIHIHPTQLYSSVAMLAAFIALAILYRRKKYDGYILAWGVIFYSIYRFVVEFLRYSPMHWLGLTPSQWMVVVMAVVAAGFLLKKKKG